MAKEHLDPVDWLLSDDVGLSSKAILCHFIGKEVQDKYAPEDRGDFGRCMRLLESPFAEGWIKRITEMNQYGEWAKLTPHWDELVKLHYAGKHAKLTATIQQLR